MLSRLRIAAFALLLVAAWTSAAWAIEWESVKSASGTVKNTTIKTKGNSNNSNRNNNKNKNNSNYREKPEYVPFEVSAAGMRIRFKTEAAGERPDLKMELQKQVTRNNGDKDWQRIGVVGRSRGDGEGEAGFASGPGEYRIELTGQNTKYTINVEQPARK